MALLTILAAVNLADDFSFVLGDSGIILNPNSSVLPFVDITKVTGLDSPEFRTSIKDHEGVDGSFIDAEFEKGRNITLEGTIYTATANMEAYLDSLKTNWAPSAISMPLYFKVPNQSQRISYVKPLGVRYDWETARRTGQTNVQFLAFAEDPRIYDSAQQNLVVNFGAQSIDGLGFPFGFPFSFGVAVEGAPGGTVVNNGNRATPAIITIQGPVTDPQIINDTESLALKFSIVLTASDSLVIDLANHTVRLNGTANRRGSLLDPNWFLFAPGESFVRFQGISGAGSTMSIQYQSAWR